MLSEESINTFWNLVVVYILKLMYRQTSIMYTSASQASMKESPEVHDNVQVLVQEV